MIEHSENSPKGLFRNDIQGLRGLAIIAVLLFHFRLGGVDGGFLGVDIFFVISGFLITSILSRKTTDSFSSGLATFYFKRLWRIFPAYIVVIILTLGTGWLILLPDDLARLGRSAGFSSAFASNFFFFKEAGYFDLSGIFKPLLHTWSLAVEIQFYLVWPLLLAVFGLGKNNSLARTLTLFFAVTLIFSTALSIGDPKNAFFMMYSRLWEFAIGGWVAVKIASRTDQSPTVSSNLLGLTALAILIISFFLITNDMTLPAPGALVPALATGVLIYLGARSVWTYRLLSLPILVWIGEISYSLYLVHWPLLVYLTYVLYPEPSMQVRALALLVSLPLALLLYRFIEVPFRDRGKRQPFSLLLMLPAIAALSATAVFCSFLLNSKGAPSRFAPSTLAQIANVEIQAAHGAQPPKNGTPVSIAANLAVWGDSHALHFKEEIQRRATKANLSFTEYYSSGCPPITNLYLKRHSLSMPKGCFAKNAKALAAILKDDKVETVILAARWAYYAQTRRFAGEAGGRAFLTKHAWGIVSPKKSQSAFATGLQETVHQLVNAGKRVVLLGQVPEFGFDPPRCIKMSIITKTANTVCKISVTKMRERQNFSQQVMEKIAATSPLISYLRTSDAFCDDTICSPLLNGKIAYSDDDHINAHGARKALKALDLGPTTTSHQ